MNNDLIDLKDEEEVFSKILNNTPYRRDSKEVLTLNLPKRLILVHNDMVSANSTRNVYVLKGSIFHIDDNRIYNQGEYFKVNKETGCSITYCLEDSDLLVSSQNKSFYDTFKKNIDEHMDILKKVQKHDLYTHEHSTRVGFLAIKLATVLGLKGFELATLMYAVRFYDIGKYYISTSILNKKGKLTDYEKSLINGHVFPDFSELKDFRSKDVEELIIQHHERFDGSGYPKGLKELEISLGAQIIGICDTYDAMIHDRPYRKKYSAEDAIEEIKSFSGKKFSKQIVDGFINIYNRAYRDILLNINS